jgi:hypothetical protein
MRLAAPLATAARLHAALPVMRAMGMQMPRLRGPAAAALAPLPLLPNRRWAGSQRHPPRRCRAYEKPEVYDIAFNFRDYEKEAAHLLAMHQRHSGGSAMHHFFEVACGPARHASTICKARQGAKATGLDCSPAMLKYAAGVAEEAGVAGNMQFIESDMTSGELHMFARKGDSAVCFLLNLWLG